MNFDMRWLRSVKEDGCNKSSYCSAFEGNIFEASLFHSTTSLNIEKFELNYANAGEFEKGSEGVFFYSSPENDNKAIYSAHHHAHAQLLSVVRPEHITDELEEYAIYECKIKPHATVVDLNLPAPLKVVKLLRQLLPICQRLKVNGNNAYSFIDKLTTGTRMTKFRTLGIDVIVNYEGPDKVYGNVIVVTDPSVINIKSSDIWNINERERLSRIMNLPYSNFT
ncbi:hypothetical protein MGA5115_01823 [Marinomonas gallaica]|uniref:Uncharacterized protein n=1 Tax=Marinomonas gallaica TaxID=1806667 RepID=A0A1C3JRG7_9GAMM|nr:hypothetical protein [Marinomonas gallaica]SBT17707.1 hypothetical protein MGA5115_01823 [Marinomonas gallaica]SBT20033.1 hypothetical protein MGA5116_00616 [Marinomonas gallaica]